MAERSEVSADYQALSENGARRAVGRKADLCPARAGRGLPAACRAEWAAVVEWNGAGLRAITAEQEDDDSAKPDGLGGVVSMLTGAAVILGERRILSCAAAWSGVLFGVFRDRTSEPPFFQSRANDPRR